MTHDFMQNSIKHAKSTNKHQASRGHNSIGIDSEALDENTPTCVGKTGFYVGINKDFEKHHHVRGEDYPNLRIVSAPEETPPRAWGRRS